MTNSKINILLISIRSDIGGGPKHMYQLAKFIEKNCAFNLFIAAPLDQPYGEIFKRQSIKHFPLFHRKFSLRKLLAMRKFIANNQIDLIHSHGFGAGIYSRLISMLCGIPVIHTFHGLHIQKNLNDTVKKYIEIFFGNFTKKYVCVSEDEKKNILLSGISRDEKIQVIHNGIDLPPRLPAKNFSHIIRLVSICRLDPHKSVPGLINCFVKSLNHFPEHELILDIYGAGEDAHKVKAAISGYENNVRILGEINSAQPILEKADIFISNSKAEGLPYSVLEAMSCGIPCLLSDVPGHKYLIKNQTAIGFRYSNPEDFQDALGKLLKEHQSVVSNAHELLRKNFVLEKQAELTFQIYEEAVPKTITVLT